MCLITIEIPKNSLIIINKEIYIARFISEEEIAQIIGNSEQKEPIKSGLYLLSKYIGNQVMRITSYKSMQTYSTDMFAYKNILKVDIIISDLPSYIEKYGETEIIDVLNVFQNSKEYTSIEEKIVYAEQLKKTN